jgi:hypothetical protein
MRRRHLAIGLFVLLLGSVLVAGGVILAAAPDGGDANEPPGIAALTVQNVSLNDDRSGDFEDVEGEGVVTCTSVGPPPDHYGVSVRGRVEGVDEPSAYRLVGRIGDRSAEAMGTGIREDGEFRNALSIPDDESADPGDRVTLVVSLVSGEETVDSVARTVTVAAADRQCVDDARSRPPRARTAPTY